MCDLLYYFNNYARLENYSDMRQIL